MRRKIILGLFAILFAVFFVSCKNNNTTNPPPNNQIQIKDNFFDPANLTVTVGTTVAWRHVGNNEHTVTSGTPTINPGVLFDSGVLHNGGGFNFTFTAPGTYAYFCRIHGINMTGTVTVQ